MAFSAVLTGTGQNCTLTVGQSTIVVSSATALVVGANIQGTGIPTGTRIGKIVGTTITLVNANGVEVTATVGGTQSLIFSSVYGSTLTISLSAGSDYATPQNIYNAGFGTMQDNGAKRQLFFAGALTVQWNNIVSGAVFDFLNWDLEFGNGGRWRFEESSIVGELRGGYLVNGTQFLKTVGPTFYCFNWNNGGAGGSSMFNNVSGTTNQGLFRMHNMRVVEISGSNASPTFYSSRMTMNVENLILDYQADSAGANAGIGAAFGTLKNTFLIKTNAGIGQTNGTNFATLDGIYYVGNYQSSPQHKFSLPNNYVLDGYAPQVLSSQFLGGFNAATLETYSNINLSSAGWGLNDLKTKYQRYGGPITLQFPRKVTLEFNDSTASNLTGVTLYIKSGAISVINSVQSGDYSANTQALNLVWNTSINSYRVCTSFVDTIDQIAQIRKFGYIEQSTSYSLNISSYSQPFFMLDDVSLSGISEATAAALTTVGINWSTKTITPTTDLTYDQINARIAWELAQTTGSANVDPRTINGSKVSLATGWSLVVNTGRTITAGTNITEWFAPTITINGTGLITAIYQTSIGTSTIWEFGSTEEPIIAGTSLAIYDGSGVTKYFNAVSTDGVYRYYIAPQSTGVTYKYAVERYGFKREEGTFISNNGGVIGYVPSYGEDVGITQANKSIVAAYTTLEDTAEIYDATANFRLSETGIKLGQLVARDGTYLDFSTYNVIFKDDNASIVSVASGTITYKALVINESTKYNAMKATPPKTILANDTEQINVLIEDANGDSQLTILGGDNLGYKLWKVLSSSPVDVDPTTGTLLATLSTNAEVFRFIGISNYDIIGVDLSSGVKRRSSMLKGSYSQSFYVGNQIQLATDAPQLIETNNKIDELILKIDTDLDVKVSTRLASLDYVAPDNTSITEIKDKVNSLENYDPTTVLAAIDETLKAVDYVAPHNTEIDSIKTTVEALRNYDDTTAQTKLDAIKAKTDVLVNTDLTGIATSENITDAKNEIIAEIDAIPTTDPEVIKNDLEIINNNVKKSSLFIPATDNLTP